MKLSQLDILSRFKKLLQILTESKDKEINADSIKLYDIHISETNKLIHSLNKSENFKTEISKYYEIEKRNFGWSYLPNENGEKAENEFWNLMKELGFYDKKNN